MDQAFDAAFFKDVVAGLRNSEVISGVFDNLARRGGGCVAGDNGPMDKAGFLTWTTSVAAVLESKVKWTDGVGFIDAPGDCDLEILCCLAAIFQKSIVVWFDYSYGNSGAMLVHRNGDREPMTEPNDQSDLVMVYKPGSSGAQGRPADRETWRARLNTGKLRNCGPA
jgi:hypothetical protein